MQQQPRAVYRVGDLTVDVGLAQVHRSGLSVPLPKLSFDLFLALIEAAPNLVSLDSLMQKVWPGLVVSPETVSQRVKLLRAALGDAAGEPKYVAGVRGRGYRVSAPVQMIVGDPSGNADAGAIAPLVTKRSPLIPAAAVALLSAAVLLIAMLPTRVANRAIPRAPAAVAPAFPAPPAPVPASRSIAVMPFADLGVTPANNILALGIPETILHQLASLRNLTVIARTSSFSFRGKDADAREIGRQLNVHYLLEGSVQSEKLKMRVTAQLIDATTGTHVWSMRFDKAPHDVFSVQDEIAIAVVNAMQVSVDASAADRLQSQGTAKFDAYLAYLQGRALMDETRVVSMRAAAHHFQEAIRIDPKFAPAYVALAEANLLAADYEVTEDRVPRVQQAMRQGWELIDQALALDSNSGAAYVVRARLESYTDAAAAEDDYRRSLVISPNYPPAYEGLAALLAEKPAKVAEALALLTRARALDPLEPRYGVTRAILLHYRLGKAREATEEIESILIGHPSYAPALSQLGELRNSEGRFADAVRLFEQALKLDPQSEWTRRSLIRAYVDFNDLNAAQSVADDAASVVAVRILPILLARREWRKAGEAAYEGIATDTLTAYDEVQAPGAFILHARSTREYQRAENALQNMAGIGWDKNGVPHRDAPPDIQMALVGLAALLLEVNDRERAAALLALQSAEEKAANPEFAERWYVGARCAALALSGKADGAIELVARRRGFSLQNAPYDFDINPMFDSIRDKPSFQQAKREWYARIEPQRVLLAQYRADGVIPERSGTGASK